ncbi:MAG: hypothetical protein A2W91_01540 [Bacteroidetes bacterium GWF2_38_335]|nr:MAG: hypothetical protein A2W91_01540 [Bacteroidetes bacterium GWF2_38_335]OFY78758.1 MAG: hypothetical protein A2281_19115 [Bacteroidetes bacterium RIFOXYA12_FULL_38_20]HBS85146.1 hypothetical protein [Bacteroidales bacterium]
MQIIFNIDLKNKDALALLNYIQSLDFIKIENKISVLSEAQKNAIDFGLKAVKYGKTKEHKEVLEETQARYPNLFKN